MQFRNSVNPINQLFSNWPSTDTSEIHRDAGILFYYYPNGTTTHHWVDARLAERLTNALPSNNAPQQTA